MCVPTHVALQPQPQIQPMRMPGSASTNSLAGAKYPSMRITDQVIEEVDEQMTITSMRNANGGNDTRPTAASLFANGPPTTVSASASAQHQPPASEPMAVPAPVGGNPHYRATSDYTRTQSFVQPNTSRLYTFPVDDGGESGADVDDTTSGAYLSMSAPVATTITLSVPPMSVRRTVADPLPSAASAESTDAWDFRLEDVCGSGDDDDDEPPTVSSSATSVLTVTGAAASGGGFEEEFGIHVCDMY